MFSTKAGNTKHSAECLAELASSASLGTLCCVFWPATLLASLLGCMDCDCNDNFVQGAKGI